MDNDLMQSSAEVSAGDYCGNLVQLDHVTVLKDATLIIDTGSHESGYNASVENDRRANVKDDNACINVQLRDNSAENEMVNSLRPSDQSHATTNNGNNKYFSD